MRLKYIYVFLISIFAVSCEPTPPAEFIDRPVVSCYLEDGVSPVLKVQKLIPFQSDVAYSAENVDALEITITDETDGVGYLLDCIGNGEYTREGLVVVEGHSYKLFFVYDNEPVTATASVPEMPENVKFSSHAIEVFSMDNLKSVKAPGGGIEITWNNESGDYYIVEGYTESSSYINSLEEGEEEPARSFKLDYTQGESITLNSDKFNYYGEYKISLLRISPEYAVMSQGGSTSSTTLVDVRGNVDGGYGIFTGVGRVTESIWVKEKSTPF